MWDGSAIDLEENLQIADELLEACAKAKIVLEVEIGVVGGEEDGVSHDINDKLYTAPGDFIRTARGARARGARASYLLAATFGNVHGVYKPGNVKLRPEILKEGQDVVAEKFGLADGQQAVQPGLPRRLRLGAGGDPRGAVLRRREDERRHRHPVRLHPAGRRPHVQELRRRPEGRRRGRQQEGLRPAQLHQAAETGMAARVVEACEDLLSAGQSRPADEPLARQPARRAAGHPAAPEPGGGRASWRPATRPPRSRRGTRRSARPGRRWPRTP